MKTTWFVFLLSLLCMQQIQAQQSVTGNINTPQNTDSNYILIVSSYSNEVTWSTSLAKKIESQIYANFPSLRTAISFLSADKVADENALVSSFQSAFQVGISREGTVEKDDYRELSIPFRKGNQKPLLMVFIGDEILQTFRALEYSIDDWASIPIISCCASDSISSSPFIPGKKLLFDSLIPLKTATFFSNSNREKHPLNITAVVEPSNIRKSLEMILLFYPDLKEIIYIDSYFPKTAYVERKIRYELNQYAPNINFRTLYLTVYNRDSILTSSVKTQNNTIFLTHSMNWHSDLGFLSNTQIDSLFINRFQTPLFSLTERNPKLRDIGNFSYSLNECATKTSEIISRILSGENPNMIPFDTVKKGNYLLNDLALYKYDLTRKAKTLDDRIYVNIQPSFINRHKIEIIIFICFAILLIAATVQVLRNRYYAKEMESLYLMYKKMYDDMKHIYTNASMNLYVYNNKGECQMKIDKDDPEITMLMLNFFQSKYIPNSLKDRILNHEDINSEIILDTSGLISRYSFSKKIFLQILASHIKDKEGNPNGFIVILVDQSKLFKEREETERFESLFHFVSNSSNIGIAFYNIFTQEGMATRSWFNNMNDSQTINKPPVYENVWEQDKNEILAQRERMRKGDKTPLRKDLRVLYKDGKYHWVHLVLFLMEYSEKEKKAIAVGVSMNIDEQKESEIALDKAKEEAERANREKDIFLANISHEIRTPLNAIVGFSNVLTFTNEQNEKTLYGDLIHKNNEMLMQMINSILELAKIDAGTAKFHYTEIDLQMLFNRLVEYAKEQIGDKPIEISCENQIENTLLYTDPDHLYQVFQNLISNAAKFTQSGSIVLSFRQTAKGNYLFFIKDTGIGIEKDKQSVIFNRFEKIDPFVQGSGLGLSLCKSIILHLGGTIGVYSTVGEGSTFWFTLPIKPKDSN
ncbi:MAG: sensor histidine kinase [Bacteroidales bacterium]|nr:sensor histidine kinase [Bacteroidales bacterium]